MFEIANGCDAHLLLTGSLIFVMVVYEKFLLKLIQNFLFKALLKCYHKQALQSYLQISQKCMLFLQGMISIFVEDSGY